MSILDEGNSMNMMGTCVVAFYGKVCEFKKLWARDSEREFQWEDLQEQFKAYLV